jgi:L-glutamine-phosphate cytidylyltransferase
MSEPIFVILAAGQGSRLMPLTSDKPKCMVEFRGRPIIDYLLDAFDKTDLQEVVVVTGYKRRVLETHLQSRNIIFYNNPVFDQTNMVSTLFAAEKKLVQDFIVSYSDIIYGPSVLQKIANARLDISVVVDNRWRDLWEMRMDDPLSDAESLKIENGRIVDIGRSGVTYEDIDGQYIGLVKFPSASMSVVRETACELIGEDLLTPNNVYMTNLLQALIKKGVSVRPIFIDGGWVEIDSRDDLDAYENSEVAFG